VAASFIPTVPPVIYQVEIGKVVEKADGEARLWPRGVSFNSYLITIFFPSNRQI